MSDQAQNGARFNGSSENSTKFDEKCLIELTKDENKSIEREAKLNCKILKIPSDFNIDEVLTTLIALDPVEYTNLFIFIIENQNSNFLAENQGRLEESLVKFSETRPLIIKMTFSAKSSSKFYYKAENSTKIFDIDQQFTKNFELFENFQSYLSSPANGELGTIESEMLQKLSFIQDSSLILKFLRTLNLQEAFFVALVLETAKDGTKADLLAVLDAPFERNGRVLNTRAQNYLRDVFEGDESESESTDEKEEGSDAENQSNEGDQEDVAMEISSESSIEDSDSSVLLTAIKHSNKEVIDYLITYWSHLIQQLPFKHQIRISTAAFETNQLDVLCDLLEISDFPFPQDFSAKSFEHSRLREITEERMKFKTAIEGENFKEIKDFIDQNSSLKFNYNPHNNNSALTEAIKLKKFGVFYYLKSLGFEGENCDHILNDLSNDEMKEARMQAAEQRKQNIKKALQNVHKSVLQCSVKSLIHNRRISKEQEVEFREIIMKWFKDIHKIAPEMLDVAASCEHLKIIFDFESNSVENASLEGSDASGAAYPTFKWIFIGAKFCDNAKEQKIKGTLAHELCHYVVGLVYENREFPYHKDDNPIAEMFKEIMEEINLWSETKSREPDDECNGIISTVFRLYPSKDFEPELIVRVVNILAQYDDDEDKSKHLQEKYKILFDFWQNHVIPELQKYLQKNKEVVKLNGNFGLLSTFSQRKIEFSSPKDMASLIDNKLTIVTTNVPKLLLINIHKHHKEKLGSLLDSQNLFLEPEKLKNNQVWEDFKDICVRNPGLNIFVDCTNGVPDNLKDILNIKECYFIFIVSNENDCMKVVNGCRKKRILNAVNLEMNYSWNDLTAESQKLLLQDKINFQNNYEFSLMELLSNDSQKPEDRSDQEQERILTDFNKIIDNQLLNLLIEKQEICLNLKDGNDPAENNFNFLYLARKFIHKRKGIKISQEELLSNVENKQYILLSDIAGTGKSWTMKNIANILREENPRGWITYVDLKQFIEEFKAPNAKHEFSSFFVEKILKSKNKFEDRLFENLYRNGKAWIIFDAFDEIAPNCADFVANLAKSFEFNDGNQLWIATRDYFEVNLQQRLQTDDVFGLSEFSEEEGINFIVASWILKDLKEVKHKIASKIEFNDFVQNSINYDKYQEKVEQIIRKIAMSENRSVGLPQLFSMIADSFKDSENIELDLTGVNIFTKFVQNLYERWSYEKGLLRKAASIKSQENDFNFWKFHQYCAIKSLFPELVDLLFPDYDDSEWKEEEIIACGLMSKNGDKFYFLHETFREFFVADYIAKALKRDRINKNVLELFITIMTIKKHEVIRMFLNDVIDESIVEKIRPKMTNFITKFHEKETFSEFFTENLENFANLFIKLFKSADYEDVRNILFASAEDVALKTKEQKLFLKFQEFMFEILERDDVRHIVHEHRIFHKIIESRLEIAVFDYFSNEMFNRTDREFVKQELKRMDENILHNLWKSQNFCTHKAQGCFELIQKFLTASEILELIEDCDSKGRNILQICLKYGKKEKLEILWMQIQNFYSSQQLSDKFKELVKQKNSDDENLLHLAAKSSTFDYFKTFWELLLKTFENKEELKNLILQKNKLANNFIHLIVGSNEPEIIEFAFKNLKENLSEPQYSEILRTKGQFNRNLLQIAVGKLTQGETFQMLWNEVKNSCKSNEKFLEILNEVDEYGRNTFNLAASFAIGEIFELMEAELAKIASLDEIRKYFKKVNRWKQNLLQAAVNRNESLKLHDVLWKTIKKYFISSEILEFIKHLDIYGHNLLIIATQNNTKEIKDLTWNEVKNVININNCGDDDLRKNTERCEDIIKNAPQSVDLENEEKEFLKLKCIKIENPKLFDDAQLIIEEKLNVRSLKDLMRFVADENVQNHQILWNHLLKIYVNHEELKNLLTEKNKKGKSFIHLLVTYNKAYIIEFTFEKINENLSKLQFQEILRSKGFNGSNLFQIAANCSKEVKTHQILWKNFQNSCTLNVEFVGFLGEVDENGSDVFNIAASLTTGEIFEFMITELVKIASQDEIRKLLKNLNKWRRNLLQQAANRNESSDLHEVLWKIIKKYFNSSEVLEFIKHLDIYGHNLLIIVTEKNTEEIKEWTWKKVEKFLNSSNCEDEEFKKNIERCDDIIKNARQSVQLNDDDEEFLKLLWMKNENSSSSKLFDDNAQLILLEKLTVKTLKSLMVFMADRKVQNHQILWNHLLIVHKSREKLEKLLTEKDKRGNNFIHLLVNYNKADIIEFTLNNLKENLSESQYQEILRSKGCFGKNLLHITAVYSKEVKTNQILWKVFQDSCKSNEEFLKILEEVDENGDNVFHLAASFTTGEIFKFMATELRKLSSPKETRKILSSFNFCNKNLLQSLVMKNKQLETNEMVWKILSKFFDAAEILKFINHSDKDGNNLLFKAVFWNAKEIVEFTWNQIKIFITSKDDQVEYLKKRGHKGKNLHQLALENKSGDHEVAIWVQNIIREFDIIFSD